MIESLFLSALISSTLLPGGSEALLAYLVSANPAKLYTLVAVATLGNTLGAMLTFLMGRGIAYRYPNRLLEKPSQRRARGLIDRYGVLSLLLSWLPLLGDALCLAAGWLKFDWRTSLILIASGKLVRYLLIGYVALEFV